MEFSDKLNSIHACSEAVTWVGNRGLMTAWRDCPRGDWMLWLAARSGVEHKLLVLAACDCAETALKYVPKGANRPAKCIQVTRDWCAGKATLDDVRKARRDAADAAYAAYAYAAYAAAADAAYADAAYAAYAAAYAYAANAAADAAAYADARRGMHKICADLVRKRISVSLIKL